MAQMVRTNAVGQVGARKSSENSWLWLFKIVAGVLIVLLLALHFIVNHLIAPSGLLSYGEVVSYYKIAIIPIIEGLFLILVISHALVGLRSIIMDLNPSAGLLRAVDWLFILVGIGSSIYGIWLLWVIANR